MLKHFESASPAVLFEATKASSCQRSWPRGGERRSRWSPRRHTRRSDPGFILVRAALDADIPVGAVPGPTALIMALVLSGLPVHAFTFRGFPPRKPGPRKRFMEVDQNSPHTLIFYESPHRLIPFLKDALEIYGDRPAAIANDLTKKFETVLRGTLTDLISKLENEKLLGEYTIVIKGLS